MPRRRIFISFIISFVLVNSCIGQVVILTEKSESSAIQPAADLGSFLRFKTIPAEYEKEALAALVHFPELRNVPVVFRVRKSFSTLKTRPSFISMFLPRGRRKYIITISSKTIPELEPISFKNLPEEARIGILGHELCHVVDFSGKSACQSLRIAAGHLSRHFMDSLEFHTDELCVRHGLGKQLEAWSIFIRQTMHTTYWRGADFVKRGDTRYERYMNPATIEKEMELKKK